MSGSSDLAWYGLYTKHMQKLLGTLADELCNNTSMSNRNFPGTALPLLTGALEGKVKYRLWFPSVFHAGAQLLANIGVDAKATCMYSFLPRPGGSSLNPIVPTPLGRAVAELRSDGTPPPAPTNLHMDGVSSSVPHASCALL